MSNHEQPMALSLGQRSTGHDNFSGEAKSLSRIEHPTAECNSARLSAAALAHVVGSLDRSPLERRGGLRHKTRSNIKKRRE